MSVPSRKLTTVTAAAEQTYPFSLPELPYAYDALEPHIDQKTLQLHHREHHATYVKKLNEALAPHAQLQRQTLTQLLRGIEQLPAEIRAAVKNNGGGHLNHDLFWNSLTPAPAGEPQGALGAALAKQFGSFTSFREKFSAAAAKHFASGWVSLAMNRGSGQLEITDLKDHEVLQRDVKTGLIMLDVWEHAYYLKYQNRRAEFITAYWNVVNWANAAEVFESAGAQ